MVTSREGNQGKQSGKEILHVFRLFLNHVHAFSLQCRFKNEQNREMISYWEKRSPHWCISEGLCLAWIPSLALCRGEYRGCCWLLVFLLGSGLPSQGPTAFPTPAPVGSSASMPQVLFAQASRASGRAGVKCWSVNGRTARLVKGAKWTWPGCVRRDLVQKGRLLLIKHLWNTFLKVWIPLGH